MLSAEETSNVKFTLYRLIPLLIYCFLFFPLTFKVVPKICFPFAYKIWPLIHMVFKVFSLASIEW